MDEFDKVRDLFSVFEKTENLESLIGAIEIVEDISDGEDAESADKAVKLFNVYMASQISKANQLLSGEAHIDQYKKQWDVLNEFASIAAHQKELIIIMNELLKKEFASRFDELVKDSVKYQNNGKGQDPKEKIDYYVKDLAKRIWKEEF